MHIPIDIIGIGKALPKQAVASSELDIKLNLKSGTIFNTTGLEKRYFIENPDEASHMVIRAVTEALDQAKIEIDDIDCIINASATAEQMIPYNAASTHKLLKPSKPIASFDINMTCLGALRAFDVAARMLGSYRRILIVTCDIASVGLDWSDIRTAGIFGDGATAMVLTTSDTGGILGSRFETHSQGYDYSAIRGAGFRCTPDSYDGDYAQVCRFEMNGKKLYKISSQILPDFVTKGLEESGLRLDDIDWVVPHQASQSALTHVVKLLGIDKKKFIDIFKDHGNQIASSIPSALHALMHSGQLKSGHKVMMIGTSAGIGLGLVIWEVP